MRFIIPSSQSEDSAGDGTEEYVLFTVGSFTASINGVNMDMAGPCRLIDTAIWVPLSFVEHYMTGVTVEREKSDKITLTRTAVEGEEDVLEEITFRVKAAKTHRSGAYPRKKLKMTNIILIGMPGCGKSTVGVLLAKTLGYDFLDTDLLLQQRAGKKLYEIIRDDGMESFLRLENETVAALENMNKTVIATGGSVVLEEKAMVRLSELGDIVYLQLPLGEIERRVSNIKTRGIARALGKD